MIGLPYDEEIVIVGRTMWTKSTSVTDIQTDGQTDRITITKTVTVMTQRGLTSAQWTIIRKSTSSAVEDGTHLARNNSAALHRQERCPFLRTYIPFTFAAAGVLLGPIIRLGMGRKRLHDIGRTSAEVWLRGRKSSQNSGFAYTPPPKL